MIPRSVMLNLVITDGPTLEGIFQRLDEAFEDSKTFITYVDREGHMVMRTKNVAPEDIHL